MKDDKQDAPPTVPELCRAAAEPSHQACLPTDFVLPVGTVVELRDRRARRHEARGGTCGRRGARSAPPCPLFIITLDTLPPSPLDEEVLRIFQALPQAEQAMLAGSACGSPSSSLLRECVRNMMASQAVEVAETPSALARRPLNKNDLAEHGSDVLGGFGAVWFARELANDQDAESKKR